MTMQTRGVWGMALVGVMSAGLDACEVHGSVGEVRVNGVVVARGLAGSYATRFTNPDGSGLSYTLTLTQSGDAVTGTYAPPQGAPVPGTVTGSLAGPLVRGTWSEPNNRPGWFAFTFAADFTSFTGQWGYVGQPASGAWNGTRQ